MLQKDKRKLKKQQKELRTLRRIRLDPLFSIKHGLSKIAFLLGFKQIHQCIEKILALDQNDHKAWSNKGLTLRRLERYQEALECIDKALALDQNYKEAWYNKAWLESLQNNKDKALEYLRKAIGLDNKYKEMAKVGGDFNNIKDSQKFKELTEG